LEDNIKVYRKGTESESIEWIQLVQVRCSREHVNEYSDSIKGGKFLN